MHFLLIIRLSQWIIRSAIHCLLLLSIARFKVYFILLFKVRNRCLSAYSRSLQGYFTGPTLFVLDYFFPSFNRILRHVHSPFPPFPFNRSMIGTRRAPYFLLRASTFLVLLLPSLSSASFIRFFLGSSAQAPQQAAVCFTTQINENFLCSC